MMRVNFKRVFPPDEAHKNGRPTLRVGRNCAVTQPLLRKTKIQQRVIDCASECLRITVANAALYISLTRFLKGARRRRR